MARYFFGDDPELFYYERLMQKVPGFDNERTSEKQRDGDSDMRKVRALIYETIKRNNRMNNDSEFFLNEEHQERFENEYFGPKYRRMRRSNKYLATIYLLTADECLWNSCCNKVGQYGIFFKEMKLRSLSPEGYVLYMAAKSIYYTQAFIEEDELIDKELVSQELLNVITNGWKLRIHGFELLEGKLVGKDNEQGYL